ncbi:MAG: transglutaminase-like cysteine peptidase [Mesorhizobium sp.]|nr:transglutaminase-like cysteine peptidase [Mesorhizobium sp.]
MGHITKTLAAIAATATLLAGASAAAQAQSFMPTTGLSSQPIGHYEFCQRMPQECGPTNAAGAQVDLTRELWAKIVEVNNLVNTMVTPRTDWEMWGVEEYWAYPDTGYGDCEAYALEKRRQLIQAGVPAASLLMTVVRQQNGEGHAVLTVNTTMGDFILDNLEPRVLRWHETDYEILKRVSERHAGQWIGVSDHRNMVVGSVR